MARRNPAIIASPTQQTLRHFGGIFNAFDDLRTPGTQTDQQKALLKRLGIAGLAMTQVMMAAIAIPRHSAINSDTRARAVRSLAVP